MARRLVDTDMWNDVTFDNFTKNERYFWLFLLTTRYGNISGCFEISQNQIAYETKLRSDEIKTLLKDFENKHKLIYYSEETNEIFILNWYKYNWSKSPKVETSVLSFVKEIKDDFFRETLEKMVIDFKEGNRVAIPYRYASISNPIPITNTISNTIDKELLDLEVDDKEVKNKYGEFNNVRLTDDEYNKLADKVIKREYYIEQLSTYIEQSGKKYKSHYATILNWYRRDEKENKVETETFRPKMVDL